MTKSRPWLEAGVLALLCCAFLVRPAATEGRQAPPPSSSKAHPHRAVAAGFAAAAVAVALVGGGLYLNRFLK